MVSSSWRIHRNEAARRRLLRNLPDRFPAAVLVHALERPLIPPTPRRAIESYWRHHIVRADRLARALAARSGPPPGWIWQLAADAAPSFRIPPAPFREAAYARGKGHCCICGQPVYRLGWHRNAFGDGVFNRNATWHSCCVAAWNLWTVPSDYARQLKAIQGRRCAASGARLARDAEVDHRTPLFRVWRMDERRWPILLRYWGIPNLQLINRPAHAAKCAKESEERALLRQAARGQSWAS